MRHIERKPNDTTFYTWYLIGSGGSVLNHATMTEKKAIGWNRVLKGFQKWVKKSELLKSYSERMTA